MKHKSIVVRRKTQTTLRQIKNYIEVGIFDSSIIDNGLKMSDDDIKKLYYLKILLEIGFTLESSKFILENAVNKNLINICDHFIESYKSQFSLFINNWNDFKSENQKLNLDRDTFGWFSSTVLARPISYEIYEARKVIYEIEEKKQFLKMIRKNIYWCFIDYKDYEKTYDLLSKWFLEFLNFLYENNLDKSGLYFICWIRWFTNEARYIKEMKRICTFNYSNEIFEMALKWIISETNKKY